MSKERFFHSEGEECFDFAIEWNTDPFYIKKEKVEEAMNWFKAMKILFNNDEYEFSIVDQSTGNDDTRISLRGRGYDINLDEKTDELEEKLVRECISGLDIKNPAIEDSVKKIIRLIRENDGGNLYMLFPEGIIDAEKSGKTVWYYNDPDDGMCGDELH